MASTLPDLAQINPDTPLRLDVAARIAFPAGGMSASGLRRERDRGRLVTERIAGKDFTTLRAIEDMREKCRDQRKVQDCGSNLRSGTTKVGCSGAQRGSSATDRARSARAALERTARGLNVRSPSTSPASTKSPASGTVVPFKSSS